MILKKLFILFLITGLGFTVKANSYVLQDDDLTVDSDGIITDCSYDFSNSDITIPESVSGTKVTGIADVNVFGTVTIFYAQGITSVVLPSGIKTIGENAFKGNDLTSVILPEGLQSIGESAFSGNDFSFTEVEIPDSVTYIGSYAFSMNGIDSITLPKLTITGFIGWVDDDGNEYDGGTKIEYDGAEYRAKILYTLQDDDVEVSDEGLITSCSYDFTYTDIIIPEVLDGITILGVDDGSWTGVFDDKGITSLQLPATMLHIGDYAFSDNELSDLTIPDGVKYIGLQAFSSNDFDDIDLPNSVTYIGQQAFWSIDSIVLPTPTESGFEYWISSSDDIYQGGEKVKLSYNSFEAKIVYTLTDADVRMTNGVIDSCLYDFSSSYIKIPDSLNNQKVTGIADGVEIYYNYYGVFSDKGIKEIQLPAYLDSIGDYAFYDNDLDSLIILPDSVKYIGLDAFTLNSSLDGVVLPAPTNGGLICENWIDNTSTVYEIGDTVTNFYGRSFSAQFSHGSGTSIISLSGSLSFGDVAVNKQASNVLIISNEGNSSFTVSSIDLPEGFTAGWTSGEITSGSNQAVPITFSPTEAKTYSGTIEVHSDASSGIDTNEISGTGIAVSGETSIISLSGSLSFGDVEVNTQTSSVLTISNDGNSSFTVSSIDLPEGFTADWTSGEVASNTAQSVKITFSPTETKTYSGIIEVHSDATNGTDTIEVSGTGITESEETSIISLSGSLNFEEVEVNTQASSVLTISNDGNSSFTVSNIDLPEGFTADWTSGEIASNSSQTVKITFSPTEAATYSGTIVVASDATSGTDTIAVSGTGTSINNSSALNVSISDNLSIYPNPASSYITLSMPSELECAYIEIFNVNGKKVFSRQVNDNCIDINDLEKGMYILKATNSKINLQTRFIKQ